MVKIDNNQTQTNSPTNQTPPVPKEETGLIKTIGQLLPLAPFVFEQFTGKKVPSMGGTMGDISLSLQQIQINQQALNQRIINLETKLTEIQTNANQHLTNLTQQFQSLRLTHTRERKQIEYNPPLENNQDY